MARYELKTVRLTHAVTEKVGDVHGAQIHSMAALESFIDDYRHRRVDYPFLVLSPDMTLSYFAWCEANNQYLAAERQRGAHLLGGMFGNAFTGNMQGMFMNLAGMYAQIASGLIYESKQPQFIKLRGHYHDYYKEGQVGVCLHCDTEGNDFSMRPGTSGWVLAERIAGRRPV